MELHPDYKLSQMISALPTHNASHQYINMEELNDINISSDIEFAGPVLSEHEMKIHKSSIYRHQLFPLLALLLEKCEQSTQSLNCVPSVSFDVDIADFVRTSNANDKTLLGEDPELDHLMVKAIQVLRIHLLELEKVNDLCKDFCSRYIACLGKINQENLQSDDSDCSLSPLQNPKLESDGEESFSANQPQIVSASRGAEDNQSGADVPPDGYEATLAISDSGMHAQPPQHIKTESADSGPQKKKKRGVFSKQATRVMRSWLFLNRKHPYPTEEQKKQMASQTNLTLLQVNNWFINARRRILPMLNCAETETDTTTKISGPHPAPDPAEPPVTPNRPIGNSVSLSTDGAVQQFETEEETDDSEDDFREPGRGVRT